MKIVGFRGWSQDCVLGGRWIHILPQPGHLPGTSGWPRTPKGTGGTPSNQVGRGVLGGMRGEEKWRRDGTGAPEGWLGEGKGSHTWRGKLWDHWEGRGSKGSMDRSPPPTWAPRSLLRSWAWSSAHQGLLQLRGSWGSGREGRGSKSKGPGDLAPLGGGWGRGGVPTPSGIHPQLGVQWGQGTRWQRPLRCGAEEQKGTWPALSLST